MIKQIEGDILLTNASVIAHGVAPNDNFHSGLALQLRERFPAMYKDFRHHCQTSHPVPGDLWVWAGQGPAGPVQIAALMTQEAAYGHGSTPGGARIEYVNHALKKLRIWIESEKPSAVAIPRLATGVGGLDWKDVEPLVHQHLAGLHIPIYAYTTYRKGVQGQEAPVAAITR
jgi:O-acetyl-ADP-ribose deacetylase (regulator of RNase III)